MKTKDVPATMGVVLKFRAEMNSKYSSLDHKLDSVADRLVAEIHRVGLLVEEQNARNRVVFDSLNIFKMRLDRVEGIEE